MTYHCEGCDMIRETMLEHCPRCEEVTESYSMDAEPDEDEMAEADRERMLDIQYAEWVRR